MVLYADGITPGAALKADNLRKSVVWYCAFIEFAQLLQYEEVWTAVALARTTYAHARFATWFSLAIILR